MKPVLSDVAMKVFEEMIGRTPSKDEQLNLRQLHDAYAGKDNPLAWWDTVHKFKLECLIGNGFDWLKERVSDDLKAIRAKDATLASLGDIHDVLDRALFYIILTGGISFFVGLVMGALMYAIAAR